MTQACKKPVFARIIYAGLTVSTGFPTLFYNLHKILADEFDLEYAINDWVSKYFCGPRRDKEIVLSKEVKEYY